MSDEQLYNNPFSNSAGFRLMVLFGVFFITLLSVAILSQAIPLIPGISERSAMFISSATQCLLAFCLPAWLTAKFASPVPSRWLYLDNAPTLKAIAGVIIVYVLALPAMNQIIEWNASIHFPQALHEVEETLRKWEESNNGITHKLLESSSIGGIITGVCIVGILTGFSEEIFFRGALQGIFVRSRIGTAISVWVAAIIFSAIHFQFFGFIPRMLMGAFFGYLLIWSRSLWVAAFAHALNNSVVVVTSSPLVFGNGNGGIDTFGTASGDEFPWGALASGIATFIFLWRFRGIFFKARNN